jgi:hypothetical protein
VQAAAASGARVTAQAVAAGALAALGAVAAALAVRSERRMQRHRQPGVGYATVTLRRDGGWRRADLFTAEGLRHQARASRWGLAAVLCWVLALVVWVALGALAVP